ncbi:hypothetical protein MN608_02120 [Microdochium nivale]|nr:hypothetical protein MN608_02120 [Microdochium nivale]
MASTGTSQQTGGQGLSRRSNRKTRATRVEKEQVSTGGVDVTDRIIDEVVADKQATLPVVPVQVPADAETPRLGSPVFSRQDRGAPAPMNQDKEHLLIAAGAIGAFILFSFIGWIVYRMLKKSGKLGGPPPMPFEASPWASRNGKFSQYSPSEPPSMYDKAEMGYGPDKAYTVADLQARSSYAYSGGGTLRRQIPVIPTQSRYAPSLQSADDRAIEQYYNELFASQPPGAARDSAMRQYRMSHASSLSSGFGDGEIVVTQPLPAPPRAAAPRTAAPSARGSAAYSRPTSWTSQPESRRETMYTTTSEDRPARFRTLSSWVNQQSGRVKRQDSRAQERGEVPVMPAVPGELSFTRQTAYR